MMRAVLLCVAIVASACFAMHAQAAMCHGSPSPSAQPNNKPILSGAPVFVKSVKNAKMYTVGTGDDTIPVVHLWGTPYEKGYAHGLLNKERSVAMANAVWAYLELQVEKALNGSIGPISPEVAKWIADIGLGAALDFTHMLTTNFTGKYFYEEMQGMSDATGVPFITLRRIHMLGELTKGGCSMFGAWGQSLKDKSGLLTMRGLDWDVDGPFKDYHEITIYHAKDGSENTFMNIGWTGWIGSISGVNDKKMSIHEIGASFPDPSFGNESSIGVPFTYVLRDILQFDTTRTQGNTRLQKANRTCNLILGIGDGKEKRMNSIEYSHSVCDIINDDNLRPVADWHKPLQGVVYHGMDWLCPSYNQVMYNQLTKYYGNLTAEAAIRDVMSIVQTGDLHVYVTDLPNDLLYVAFAARAGVAAPKMAYDRSYIKIDLKAIWAVTPPTEDEYTPATAAAQAHVEVLAIAA